MTYPISLHYSDGNKKNTFNNGDNKGHSSKNAITKQTLTAMISHHHALRIMSLNYLDVKKVPVTNSNMWLLTEYSSNVLVKMMPFLLLMVLDKLLWKQL